MATLLALPNEILLNIIEELIPDDLPYFALSCKRMRALSRKKLISYRECQKKYPVVSFYGCPEEDSKSHLPALLQHMIADHMIAYCPRSMILEYFNCGVECVHKFEYSPGNEDNDHSDNEAEKLGTIEKLNSIINHFDNGTTKTKDESTDQVLGAGKVWLYDSSKWTTMLSLVLTTFPNIETLTLRYYWDVLLTVQDLLWNAVEENRGPGHTGPTILTKLKTVIVESGGSDAAEIFACFALFPSVERLIGIEIASPHRRTPSLSWTISEYLRLWHPSRAVTEIDFRDSRLSFEYFSQLLCGITRLKRFTYSFRGGLWRRRWGNSYSTDPYRLIDLLLLHAKTTLEYLELKGFGLQTASPPDGTAYGCLRDFEVLKEIRVHAALWTISGTHHQPFFHSKLNCVRCDDLIVFPLVEMLPSCVETVYLEGPFHMPCVNHLLIDLASSKGRRLRNLKTIAFRGVVRPSASMLNSAKVWMEECAGCGIYLDFEWNDWFSDLIKKR